MSGAERADRLVPGHKVTVDDIRALGGPSTPHFALQLKQRVTRLIGNLAHDDPARIEGERLIARLERIAREGQGAGPVQEWERPLPSLRLPRRDGH